VWNKKRLRVKKFRTNKEREKIEGRGGIEKARKR